MLNPLKGRGLDVRVAEKVMGQERLGDCPLGEEGCPGRYTDVGWPSPCLPPYSTDWNAAALVVSAMERRRHCLYLQTYLNSKEPEQIPAMAAFAHLGEPPRWPDFQDARQWPDFEEDGVPEVAEAICRAALSALELEEPPLDEHVQKLPAGRELDAMVAERVMGYPIQQEGEEWCYYTKYGRALPSRYSLDISAAWEVVRNLRETVGNVEIRTAQLPGGGDVTEVWVADVRGVSSGEEPNEALAICRAALAAVGGFPGGWKLVNSPGQQ